MLKQISVIAGDLKDLARRPETEPILDHVDILARMLDPGGRVRRKICVLSEDMLRLDIFLQLHQEALVADENVQRKVWLHCSIWSTVRKAFTKRGHPEIDECRHERGTAQPADRAKSPYAGGRPVKSADASVLLDCRNMVAKSLQVISQRVRHAAALQLRTHRAKVLPALIRDPVAVDTTCGIARLCRVLNS